MPIPPEITINPNEEGFEEMEMIVTLNHIVHNLHIWGLTDGVPEAEMEAIKQTITDYWKDYTG